MCVCHMLCCSDTTLYVCSWDGYLSGTTAVGGGNNVSPGKPILLGTTSTLTFDFQQPVTIVQSDAFMLAHNRQPCSCGC
jgi:hypothetical protein